MCGPVTSSSSCQTAPSANSLNGFWKVFNDFFSVVP
jgi:hypothetical protein